MPDIQSLILKHLSLCTTDFNAWLELIHEDVLLEFPYAASVGNPPSIRGKSAVADGVQAFFAQVPALRFIRPTVFPSADPTEGFATYAVDTIVPATGRRYAQDYIAQFRATDGQLSFIREYYDPVRLAHAFQAPTIA